MDRSPTVENEVEVERLAPGEPERHLADLESQMREAAKKFEFERAAQLRDRLKALKGRWLDLPSPQPGGEPAQVAG